MPADPKKRPIRVPYDEWYHWDRKYIVRDHALPAPSVGIFDFPRACIVLNLEWASHVVGAMSALIQDDAWTGDDDEQFRARQEMEKLIRLMANACTGGSDVILRQNPANACQLQQSIDGGATWTLAFDYSLCRSNSPSGNYTVYNDTQNTINNYNQTWNENPTVADFTPDLVYDGGETEADQMRDNALCYAVQAFYDSMVQFHANAVDHPPQRPIFEIIATLTFAILGGLAAEAFSGGFATPVVVGALVGAIGNAATQFGFNFNATVTAEQMASVRDDLVCCIYTALKGTPLTESAFQASADGCDFEEDSLQANTASIMSQYFQDHSVFLTFLKFMSEAYGIGQLGIELPLCPCEDGAFSVSAIPDPTAEPPGQDSGFDVIDGHDYHIIATGIWSGGFSAFDANGWVGHSQFDLVLPTTDVFRLIFRIGASGAWHPAGTDVAFTADADGRLYFAMNDAVGAFTDQSGALTVMVEEI